jgi:hypothetical protein
LLFPVTFGVPTTIVGSALTAGYVASRFGFVIRLRVRTCGSSADDVKPLRPSGGETRYSVSPSTSRSENGASLHPGQTVSPAAAKTSCEQRTSERS